MASPVCHLALLRRTGFGWGRRRRLVDPAHVALAFVARRQGAKAMPAATWAHVLSLELGWLPPKDAKAFVAACLDAGLLAGDPATLQVPADVDVPRGFRLEPGVRPEAIGPSDPFLDLVQAVIAETGNDQGSVLGGMAEVQAAHGGLLDATAALLLWASGQGMDVRGRAAEALRADSG